MRGSAVKMPGTSVKISHASAPSAAASATAVVSEPPRPSVVTSRVVVETPWKPATIAIFPCSSASCTRPRRISTMRALPCRASVTMPACDPVKETASRPRSMIAIETSATAIRSPAVRSMSCSRGCGSDETRRASSISRSVVSPIAETTTQTSLPASAASTTRRATRLISSGPATDVPPYFWTSTAIGRRLPAAGVEAEPGVRVRVQRPQGRRQVAEPEQPAGDPPARELGRALRVLEADRPEPGAGEGREVGPQRVDVLVDAELLLVLLLRIRGARVRGARALVQRGDDAAAARHARELAAHRRKVECVVERRDAERDVEAPVGEREPLPVGLDAEVGADALLEEPAAAEPDQRVDDEVGGHVGAAAGQEVLRGPALRRADLEHPVAGADEPLEEDAEAVLGGAPGAVCPPERAVRVGEDGVEPVVGLVPALLAGERRPRRRLPELRLEPRRVRVDQAEDAVLGAVAPAAAAAREPLVQPAAARGADDERRDHAARLTARPPGQPPSALTVPGRTVKLSFCGPHLPPFPAISDTQIVPEPDVRLVNRPLTVT